MLHAIVHFSIKNKLFVGVRTLFLLIGEIYVMLTLLVDAVPDITNNQVLIMRMGVCVLCFGVYIHLYTKI